MRICRLTLLIHRSLPFNFNTEIDLDSVDGSLLSNNESGPPPMTRTDSVHTLSTVNTSTTFQNPDSHVSASNRRIEAAALRGGGETARGSGDSLDDATADSSVVATPIPTPKKNSNKSKKPADCPRISFHDSAQNLATGSTWNLTKAIPVDEKDDDDSDVDEEKDVLLTSKFAYKPGKKSGSVRAAGLKSSIKQPRYSDRSLAKKDDKPKSAVRPAKVVPSVRRNSNPQREVRDAPTAQSVMRWDLNGKGRLDEIEMAMRERDVDGDGTLSKREVKSIIEDQLRDQSEYRLYCKMACYLMGLVLLPAVSNLGTSLAAVVLAKDTALDPATGTVQHKGSNEVTGMQATAYHLELAELSDEEFEERRLLVDAEMAEDPDHPDHHHRRLGRRSRPTKVNTCGCTRVAYDSVSRFLGRIRRLFKGRSTYGIKIERARKYRVGLGHFRLFFISPSFFFCLFNPPTGQDHRAIAPRHRQPLRRRPDRQHVPPLARRRGPLGRRHALRAGDQGGPPGEHEEGQDPDQGEELQEVREHSDQRRRGGAGYVQAVQRKGGLVQVRQGRILVRRKKRQHLAGHVR